MSQQADCPTDIFRAVSSPNIHFISNGSPAASKSPAVDTPRTVQRQMTSSKQEIRQLNRQLQLQDVTLSETDRLLRDLKKQLNERSRELSYNKRLVTGLKKEKDGMEAELTAEMKKLIGEIDSLKQKLHDAKAVVAERDELRRELSSAYGENEKIRKDLASTQAAKEKLEERMKEEKTKMITVAGQWDEERKELMDDVAKKETIIKELRDQVDILASEVEMVRREQFETSRNLAQIRGKTEDLEMQLTRAQQHSADNWATAESEKSAKAELQLLLEGSRATCAKWLATVTELREKEAAREADYSQELRKKEETINDLLETARQAELHLQAVKAEQLAASVRFQRELADLRTESAQRSFLGPVPPPRHAIPVSQSPSILSLSSQVTTRSAESALSFESAKKMGFQSDCDDEPMVLENNRIASGTIVGTVVPSFKRPLTPTPVKQLSFSSESTDFLPTYRREFERDSKRFRSNSVDSPSRMEDSRLREIQHRNSLMPAALKSSYPIETQVCNDRGFSEHNVKFPTRLSTPPNDTPVVKPRKRESVASADLSSATVRSSNRFSRLVNTMRSAIGSPTSKKETKPIPKSIAFEIPKDVKTGGSRPLSVPTRPPLPHKGVGSVSTNNNTLSFKPTKTLLLRKKKAQASMA